MSGWKARSWALAVALALVGICQAGALAQAPVADPTNRLAALEAAVRTLTDRVSELTALLRAVLPPSLIRDIEPFQLDISDASAQGSSDAPVAIIEFADFECPFCGRHAQTVYRDIQRVFGETGKIKYVFRHYPIEQLHPSALKAAEGAECAGLQGKFWEMHGLLFGNQKALRVADLQRYADNLGLDVPKFSSCLQTGATTDKVEKDLAEAKRLGLTGTPAFFLGEIDKDGSVRVVKQITGAQPFTIFQSAIESILRPR